jgi:hypothetical protein
MENAESAELSLEIIAAIASIASLDDSADPSDGHLFPRWLFVAYAAIGETSDVSPL